MKKLFFILIGLVVFFCIIYLNVGGFEKASVVHKTSSNRFIIGKSFEGNAKGEDFSALFL